MWSSSAQVTYTGGVGGMFFLNLFTVGVGKEGCYLLFLLKRPKQLSWCDCGFPGDKTESTIHLRSAQSPPCCQLWAVLAQWGWRWGWEVLWGSHPWICFMFSWLLAAHHISKPCCGQYIRPQNYVSPFPSLQEPRLLFLPKLLGKNKQTTDPFIHTRELEPKEVN